MVEFCYDDVLGPGGDIFERNNDTWGQSVSFGASYYKSTLGPVFLGVAIMFFMDSSAPRVLHGNVLRRLLIGLINKRKKNHQP